MYVGVITYSNAGYQISSRYFEPYATLEVNSALIPLFRAKVTNDKK